MNSTKLVDFQLSQYKFSSFCIDFLIENMINLPYFYLKFGLNRQNFVDFEVEESLLKCLNCDCFMKLLVQFEVPLEGKEKIIYIFACVSKICRRSELSFER